MLHTGHLRKYTADEQCSAQEPGKTDPASASAEQAWQLYAASRDRLWTCDNWVVFDMLHKLSCVLWCAGLAAQALAGLQAVADAAVAVSCADGSTNGSGAGAQQLPVTCLVQGVADLLLVSKRLPSACRWRAPHVVLCMQ